MPFDSAHWQLGQTLGAVSVNGYFMSFRQTIVFISDPPHGGHLCNFRLLDYCPYFCLLWKCQMYRNFSHKTDNILWCLVSCWHSVGDGSWLIVSWFCSLVSTRREIKSSKSNEFISFSDTVLLLFHEIRKRIYFFLGADICATDMRSQC